MTRALLMAALLPLSALAQLQVFEFDGTRDIAIGSLLDVGTVAPGDTLETRFHVRNIGSGPATFSTLSLAGQGFSIASAPSLPYTLAPYVGLTSEAEFRVAFSPKIAGSFSAFLAVNDLNIVLQGASKASVAIGIAGSQTPLAAGATVNFGPVAVGSSQTQAFALSNTGAASLKVSSVSVSGDAFSGPTGITTPLSLGPGQSAQFQVKFTPQSGVAYQGTLSVDGRSFVLKGQGLVAPIPTASIVFASNLGASAQHNSVSIPLASESQVSGTGTLELAFQPSVPGVTDDPAIQFLTGALRKATVTVAPGATSATFGGQSSIAFQTGTTAGTITFTLTLGNQAPQNASLTITPSPVVLDSANAIREMGSVNVSFSGFDNTYSASRLAFTFYDVNGNALPQGAIQVDAKPQFQPYFSSTKTGGAFSLLARFPVTGSTAQLGYVTAQITSSAGTTTATKIAIGN